MDTDRYYLWRSALFSDGTDVYLECDLKDGLLDSGSLFTEI